MPDLDFPAWIRVTHFINIIFMTFLIRSGIEILGTHPKLYWNDHSKPGSEWARFTRKVMPKDKLYDTLDEEEDYSSIVAMPGHKQLGLGRHWHFFSVIGWILCGLTYVILLFATGEWRRYWPYSWEVFPQAFNDVVTYLTSEEYKIMAAHNFADYRLEVGGLVERPMTFTLEDLRTFPTKQTQRVLHNCVQGWTSIGEWSGVPLRQIVELVKPRPTARYVCFWTMQDSGRDEPSAPGGGQFYEVIDMALAYTRRRSWPTR